jgi:hypothetical protein
MADHVAFLPVLSKGHFVPESRHNTYTNHDFSSPERSSLSHFESNPLHTPDMVSQEGLLCHFSY